MLGTLHSAVGDKLVSAFSEHTSAAAAGDLKNRVLSLDKHVIF